MSALGHLFISLVGDTSKKIGKINKNLSFTDGLLHLCYFKTKWQKLAKGKIQDIIVKIEIYVLMLLPYV